MVKTGLKWPKTTQNVSKTVFLWLFGKNSFFSIFWPRMAENG
jgi:hypothetical protein